MEALITLGKCREMPVVGFVRGILVMGVIVSPTPPFLDVQFLVVDGEQDEITRRPVNTTPTLPETRSVRQTQTSLTTIFSPTKPRPVVAKLVPRTHELFVSDSKTRASGTLPREGDTIAGRFQVMLYKELLDAMLLSATPIQSGGSGEHANLPTETPFSFAALFAHLGLDEVEGFSEDFIRQSPAVVSGNALRFGAGEARSLVEMGSVWAGYVLALGLGSGPHSSDARSPLKIAQSPSQGNVKGNEKGKGKLGQTEERLELVYRRAGPAKERTKKRRGKRRKDEADEEDEKLIELAVDASLEVLAATPVPGKPPDQSKPPDGAERDWEEREREEDELAWALDMSLGGTADLGEDEGGEVLLRASQRTATPTPSLRHPSSPQPSPSQQLASSSLSPWQISPPQGPQSPTSDPDTPAKPGTSSGSIIGRHRFTHSPRLLAAHLSSVLEWWLGQREAIGVGIEETRRCGWCEFEEGCEWR